jgi:hypothetical protein
MKQAMVEHSSSASHSFLLDDDSTLPFVANEILAQMDDKVCYMLACGGCVLSASVVVNGVNNNNKLQLLLVLCLTRGHCSAACRREWYGQLAAGTSNGVWLHGQGSKQGAQHSLLLLDLVAKRCAFLLTLHVCRTCMWLCQCLRPSGQETMLAALPSWKRSCGSARCNAVACRLAEATAATLTCGYSHGYCCQLNSNTRVGLASTSQRQFPEAARQTAAGFVLVLVVRSGFCGLGRGFACAPQVRGAKGLVGFCKSGVCAECVRSFVHQLPDS